MTTKPIILALVLCTGSVAQMRMAGPIDEMEPVGSTRTSTAPQAGWKTFVLSSAAEIRLPAPPAGNAAQADQQLGLFKVMGRTRATLKEDAYWNAGSPSYRWVELATSYVENAPMSNPRNTRFLAMLNVAVYDAMVAAWNNKYFYQRRRPATAADQSTPSYPAEHAVAAGAAAAVLAYFYPAEAQRLTAMAQEAADAQVNLGNHFPSDTSAGLELGRQVAAKVIAMAERDGSDAKWTGVVPQGPGYWVGTNPAEPLAGTWKPIVLPSTSMFRPGPPPAFDSDARKAEVAEVKGYARTFATNAKAMYYQTMEGIFTYWYGQAHKRIFEYNLTGDAPRAALIYALLSIAHHDACLAGWEAKYSYWAMRPFQYDSTLVTLFPTPNHPSYPAAHGFFSGAIARMLAHLFPREAAMIDAKADEAAESRVAAGIHFRSDVVSGLELGRKVADFIAAEMEQRLGTPLSETSR